MKNRVNVSIVLLTLGICTMVTVPSFHAGEEEETFWEPIPQEEVEIDVVSRNLPQNPSAEDMIRQEIRETENWDDDCLDSTLEFSQEDAERLMMISTAEASTEGVIGQLYVMEVIINRVNSPDYPNTVQEVIEQRDLSKDEWKYQFCTVREGVYQRTVPNANAHLALAMLEQNKDLDTEIIAFETTSNGESLLQWFDYKFTYKHHNFYRRKKS